MDQQSPFPAQPTQSSGNVGPLAAAVVIVLLLAAGGFYFFYTQQQKQAATQPQAETAQTSGGDSDTAIESDLNATQTSGSNEDVTSLNDAL